MATITLQSIEDAIYASTIKHGRATTAREGAKRAAAAVWALCNDELDKEDDNE